MKHMDRPGRYRRAFDWRLNRSDAENTAAAVGGFSSLFSSEMPDVLEDYLLISRKRQNNRLALARLQSHLVDELLSAEATIKHYREKKAELEQLDQSTLDEPQQAAVRQDMKLVRREHFLWRAFANVIRSIGDGIAWRALGYDRAVLRALCQARGSQQITSPGTVEELREWARQFDHGSGIAILNSLTNWLTYGDITVVQNDGAVEVIEVKSSNTTSSRVVRQKQRMRELVTFLSSGMGSLEGKTVEVCTLDIFPKNSLDTLHRMLQQTSIPPGYTATRISNSSYVECLDLRVLASGGEADLVNRRMSLIQDWREKNDDVHHAESLENLSFGPNLAPFSVFPFDPAVCIDLLTGAKAYMVLLNVTAVARQFEKCGWQIVNMPKDAYDAGKMEEDFMTVRKGGFRITVPPAAFMRMEMELLHPQVLIRQCELMRQAGPDAFNSEFNFAVYEHESEIWD